MIVKHEQLGANFVTGENKEYGGDGRGYEATVSQLNMAWLTSGSAMSSMIHSR